MDHQNNLALQLAKNTFRHLRIILIAWCLTFAVSCLIILPIPRYYTCTMTLAPETVGTGMNGTIASLANSFGLNVGGGATADAISPELYPELLQSPQFLATLMTVPVKTRDGQASTDFYTYITEYTKPSVVDKVMRFLSSDDEGGPLVSADALRPDSLSRKEWKTFEAVQKTTSCDVDLKTGLISISFTDRDPLVSAIMVQALCDKMQAFITDYRTKKARVDYEYYKRLSEEAKSNYENARQAYAAFASSHNNVVVESVRSKLHDLESDMQLKFNTYSAMVAQYESSKAKLQENTPAFTVVKGASVPYKPAGPKRMAFIFVMMFLSTLVTLAWINRKILW